MEAHHYAKAKVRRLVGFVDGVLTLALIIQIICYTIYPLLNKHEVLFSLRSELILGKSEPKEVQSSKWWIWPLLGLCVLLAMVPVLAAGALIFSTCPSNNDCGERALEMTKCWLNCNTFTIIIFAIEFVVVSLIHLIGVRIGIPLLTLLYLGIRVIFTWIIWRQLDSLIETLDANLEEIERRATIRKINRMPLREQRSESDFHSDMLPPSLRQSAYHDEESSPEPIRQNVSSQTEY